jgi:spore coat polysaccharide biosynthesis protein SpsF (cytidylyltransferase family)
MIQWVLERLQHCAAVGQVVVATSDLASDDPLIAWAEQQGLRYSRGSLQCVARRVLTAATEHGATSFFRVNGDSPLVDPDLFVQAHQVFVESHGQLDLVTNVFPRSYPPGASVELIKTQSMARAVQRMSTEEEQEHVTKHFYLHAKDYVIHNIMSPVDYSGVDLAIDTVAHWETLERFQQQLTKPQWECSLRETSAFFRV